MSDDEHGKTAQTSSNRAFLPFIGEQPLPHEMTWWNDNADLVIASHGLTPIASGDSPLHLSHLIERTIDHLPQTAITDDNHRDHLRCIMEIDSVDRHNAAIQAKKAAATLEGRNKLYILFAASMMKTAPTLLDFCQKKFESTVVAGFYDGYKIRMHLDRFRKLDSMDPALKRQAQNFYNCALNALVEAPLDDNSNIQMFRLRLKSFLLYINPYLSRRYAGEDVGMFILSLPPPKFKVDMRRLAKELTGDGKLGDAQVVKKEVESVYMDEDGLDATRARSLAIGDANSAAATAGEIAAAAHILKLQKQKEKRANGGSGGGTGGGGGGAPGDWKVKLLALAVNCWCTSCPHIDKSGKESPCSSNPACTVIPSHVANNAAAFRNVKSRRVFWEKERKVKNVTFTIEKKVAPPAAAAAAAAAKESAKDTAVDQAADDAAAVAAGGCSQDFLCEMLDPSVLCDLENAGAMAIELTPGASDAAVRLALCSDADTGADASFSADDLRAADAAAAAFNAPDIPDTAAMDVPPEDKPANVSSGSPSLNWSHDSYPDPNVGLTSGLPPQIWCAVYRGHATGVYHDDIETIKREYISGFDNAIFETFSTKLEAHDAYARHLNVSSGSSVDTTEKRLSPSLRSPSTISRLVTEFGLDAPSSARRARGPFGLKHGSAPETVTQRMLTTPPPRVPMGTPTRPCVGVPIGTRGGGVVNMCWMTLLTLSGALPCLWPKGPRARRAEDGASSPYSATSRDIAVGDLSEGDISVDNLGFSAVSLDEPVVVLR